MKTLPLSHQLSYQLSAKFGALAALENGWLEGQGLAPDKSQLALVEEKFVADYPENLGFPFIVPTPEGNLLFEWDAPGSPSVDLELASMNAQFHAFAPDGSDIESEFTLSTETEWNDFFAFLKLILTRMINLK